MVLEVIVLYNRYVSIFYYRQQFCEHARSINVRIGYQIFQLSQNVQIKCDDIYYFNIMKRLWPFRNFKNFTITVFGLTGGGLIYNSINNQSVFSRSPIVSQAVKVLGLNNTTRALLGNPITYSGSYSNTHNIKQEEQFFSFQVEGSKSKTTAELTSKRMKVSDIRQILNKVKNIQNELQNKKQQQQKLTIQLGKAKRQQKDEISKRLRILQEQLLELNNQFKSAKQAKQECLKKYYIPSSQTLQIVTRTKNPDNPLSGDEYLYGIEALQAILPNKKVLGVIPNIQNQDLQSVTNAAVNKFSNINDITQGYLNQRLKFGLEGLTEQEIQSYGKHKTRMMYNKYNGYRIGLTVFLTAALITVFLTWHIYRVIPVSGSFIALSAQTFFLKHSKTGQILRALKKQNQKIKFAKIVSGGKKGDNFDCSVNVEGVPGMKVFFQGSEDSKGKVQFKKFHVDYQQGQTKKRVDLL